MNYYWVAKYESLKIQIYQIEEMKTRQKIYQTYSLEKTEELSKPQNMKTKCEGFIHKCKDLDVKY